MIAKVIFCRKKKVLFGRFYFEFRLNCITFGAHYSLTCLTYLTTKITSYVKNDRKTDRKKHVTKTEKKVVEIFNCNN